jgi:hypothetical protein
LNPDLEEKLCEVEAKSPRKSQKPGIAFFPNIQSFIHVLSKDIATISGHGIMAPVFLIFHSVFFSRLTPLHMGCT